MFHAIPSLKGLSGVRVVVEEFRRAAEDAGFDTMTFQTDVELKLRLAGIRVFAADAALLPALYLNVNALHGKADERHGYGINLFLLQEARLQRPSPADPGKQASEGHLDGPINSVATWYRGMVGVGQLAHVRSGVKDLVDEFVNDWLAANPRDATPPA